MNFSTSTNVHREFVHSRRDFLARAGGGFGLLALLSLLQENAHGSEASVPEPVNLLQAKESHFRPRAKSVIWCFLDGGPSHIDLFDPKPELKKLAGKPLPGTFKRPVTSMGRTAFTPLLATRRKFKQHGQSGIWVSDWYPEIATCVDDIAVVRSCRADGLNHVGSICQMNTGSILGGRPCLGSWALYGLGSVSANLPGYVVLLDYPEDPPGGSRNWSTGFMPPTYQGTKFRNDKMPILSLAPQQSVSTEQQRAKLDFIQTLNRRHLADRSEDGELEARITAYELAYRMQAAAPEAVDIAKETEGNRRL